MTDIKKVIVNGVEYEVSVEVTDGGKWHATVEGTTFEVEIPDAGPVVKKKRAGGGRRRNLAQCRQIFPARLLPSK